MDLTHTKTDIQVDSKKLLSSFMDDEVSANFTYVEKTLEVVGIVEKISTLNNRHTIFLQGEDEQAFVICDMEPTEIDKIKTITPGQTVRLKGVCKGFLMDAIFLHCVLLDS